MARSTWLLTLSLLGLLSACDRSSSEGKPADEASGSEAAAAEKGANADVKVDDSAGEPIKVPPKGEGPIAWFHDDFKAAEAAARKAKLPLVVDMWAPWCHTCLSMQASVLMDPSFGRYADRFVWVALDTDKPENAPMVGQLKMSMWPTFFVLDPSDTTVMSSFAGAASLKQFQSLLEDGEAGYLDRMGKALGPKDPRRPHRAGLQAMQAGDWGKAVEHLEQAIELGGGEWSRRGDAAVDLLRATLKGDKPGDCLLRLADGLEAARSARSATTTDYVYYAGRCFEERPAAAERLRPQLIAALEELEADGEAPLSLDDRSDLLVKLRELHTDAGKEDKAKEIAQRQQSLLRAAFANAKSPREAMTYNWPRAEVHVYLGEKDAEALIPDLEANAKDLPDEYDPPYRLAWVLQQLGRSKEAREPIERAAELAYGPRKARVLGLKAEIELALEDTNAARATRAAEVELWESMPEGQRRPEALGAARKALAELSK